YRRNLQAVDVGINEVRGNLQKRRVHVRRRTANRLQGWAHQLSAPAYRYGLTRLLHRYLAHPLVTLATLRTGTRPGEYGCRCGRDTGVTRGCTIGVCSALRGRP